MQEENRREAVYTGVTNPLFTNGHIYKYLRADTKDVHEIWVWNKLGQMETWIMEQFLKRFSDSETVKNVSDKYRTFDSGASRDTDEGKLDFEAFLSPTVLESYANYMHDKREMPDGTMRDGDNWQKGIPKDAYMKSMWRHFFDVWKDGRGLETKEDEIENLNALLFNVMGLLHEKLKKDESS